MTSKELNEAADLIHQGIKQSIFANSTFDRDAFKAYVTEHPDNILVVREGTEIVGVLFFMINDGIFLSGTTVAVEIAWTVKPGMTRHWFKLLDMFEEKAKELGAHHCSFGSYVPRMDKMYYRKGYANDYSTFIKDLR